MPVYIQDRNNFIPKVAWYKASHCDIDTYKYNLQHELENLTVPVCINECTNSCCESLSHQEDINKYYDSLLDVLMSAGEHLPKTCKPYDNTRVPGWTKYVKHLKMNLYFGNGYMTNRNQMPLALSLTWLGHLEMHIIILSEGLRLIENC